jgi:hypothetical protein
MRTQRNLVQALEYLATFSYRERSSCLYGSNCVAKKYLLFVEEFFSSNFFDDSEWEIACQSAAEWVKYNVYKEK